MDKEEISIKDFNIDTSKLKVGQEIKNYKELCKLTGMKENGGNAKQKQLTALSVLCDYTRKGYKFVINEIYKEPKLPEIKLDDITNNRNSKYIKPLSNIIVEYLYNKPDDVKNVPLSKLFTMFGITNTNYNDCKYYRKELSQLYDIRLASIYYFYSNTRMEFKNIVERCLNYLKSRRVLNWYKTIMIKDSKTGQLYQADRDTEKFIIGTERKALEYMGFQNMYQIVSNKRNLIMFNDIVKKETGGIEYFYTYDLVIGIQSLRSEYIEVMKEKQLLNELVMGRTKDMFNKEKYKIFEEDYNKLNDILIDIANKDFIKGKLIEKREENNINYIKEKTKLDEQYNEHSKEIEDRYLDIYDL